MKYVAWAALLLLVIAALRCSPGTSIGGRKASTRIDLLGLGSIELPAGFQLLGMADVGDVPGPFTLKALATPEYVEDSAAATLLFEKDPTRDWGAYQLEPVLLTLTLYNPAVPAPDPAAVLPFRVHRYYGPDPARIIAADSPRWQTAREGALHWRWLEMEDQGKPRWAIVLFDPERHLRLDFFVWTKKYALDEARALLRAAADSVLTTPMLAEHFQRATTYRQRVADIVEQRLAELESLLAPLGLGRLQPGEPAVAAQVAALLDRERQTVTVARRVGALPLAADTPRGMHGRPEIPLALQPGQYVTGNGSVDGRPNLRIAVLYWDAGAGRWRASELQRRSGSEDEVLPPLLQSVADRLADRASADLLSVARFRLSPLAPDWTGLPQFLQLAAVYQTDLAAGRIVAARPAVAGQ